jgi:hypothetical protein
MNEWIWSNGGMILTGENWSTGRKTLYSVGGRWMSEYGAMVGYWRRENEILGESPITTLSNVSSTWTDMDMQGRLKPDTIKCLNPLDISGHSCSSEICMYLPHHALIFHTCHPRCNELRCTTLRHGVSPVSTPSSAPSLWGILVLSESRTPRQMSAAFIPSHTIAFRFW